MAPGSTVMVGYLRAGSLQVRQPFTNDLGTAARALREAVEPDPRSDGSVPSTKGSL